MSVVLKIYQVDAFTDTVFGGNPAAVIRLDEWLPEETMQKIASENNLAETAFLVGKGVGYEIRWFTPNVEVDLCGHATLASAHVLFNYYGHPSNKISFQSGTRGALSVTKEKNNLSLDFPVDVYNEIKAPSNLVEALGINPTKAYKGLSDYVFILSTQKEVENASPNFSLLENIEGRGFIISSPGEEVDFVSRFFAPRVGIREDPVTGSAHTTLTPIWSKKLGKTKLTAKQLSKRKGYLQCELNGDRVMITGKAITYMTGEIFI